MKKINDITTALIVFQEAAEIQSEATETGNYKLGNKNYDIIIKTIKYLKDINQMDHLHQLLNATNVGVRLWAATYLLPIYEDDALEVLIDISKRKGLVSFTAEMTIQEWRKGNLISL